MEKGLTQTQGKPQAWITNKNLLHLQLPSACNLANTYGPPKGPVWASKGPFWGPGGPRSALGGLSLAQLSLVGPTG